MRKILVALFVLLLIVSCSSEVVETEHGLGYVTFGNVSKGVIASVEYPSVFDKTWNITAVKTDDGETIGEGEIEGVLLTDSCGPFSTGSWSFVLEGYDGETKIYEGEVDAVIHTGSNALDVPITSVGDNGRILITGSNIKMPTGKTLTSVFLYVDNAYMEDWTLSELTLEDDLYMIPDYEQVVTKGVHTIRVEYSYAEAARSRDVYTSISIRTDANATTSLSFGTFQGRLTFNAEIDGVDALVTE